MLRGCLILPGGARDRRKGVPGCPPPASREEVAVGSTGRKAEEEGRSVAWVLAEGHRWKEVVLVYSFIYSTNIY